MRRIYSLAKQYVRDVARARAKVFWANRSSCIQTKRGRQAVSQSQLGMTGAKVLSQLQLVSYSPPVYS